MGSTQEPSAQYTLQIEDYALIGNMRTCALVGNNGSIDFLCWPRFDSPSIFARLLDTENGGGGHWIIRPHDFSVCKQNYIASTNMVKTKWIHEDGVLDVTDFFAVDGNPRATRQFQGKTVLVRKVQCIRGKMNVDVELSVGLDYGRSTGSFTASKLERGSNWVRQYVYPDGKQDHESPSWVIDLRSTKNGLSPDVQLFRQCSETEQWLATIPLEEGQELYMAMSDCKLPEGIDSLNLYLLESQTFKFWKDWVRYCKYRGRFQQEVERSLLILKLLTFDETGAIVAAPTFSLPEAIGGGRNWDYRYSWIRDSSFTVYVFLKMGYPLEAENYMNFIFDRIKEWRNQTKMKHLPLMFGIHGETDLPETELTHLGGYRNSKPVRIGNAATDHVQLDIYGELMDAIYLYNKHGKPVSYQQWLDVRHLTDFVCTVWQEPDMSIWEVRGGKQNFTYSKMMLWVAVDRAIRLSEKRNFPCPQRLKWMEIRDKIYEEIMERGFNKKMNAFIQSYENNTILDAAVLIAPLVFFISPNDPQFIGTLDAIRKTPEEGGLTSADFVFRYNHAISDDGKLNVLRYATCTNKH